MRLLIFMPVLFTQMISDILQHIEDFLASIFDVERFIEWLFEWIMDLSYFAQLGTVVLAVVIGVIGILGLAKALAKFVLIIVVLIGLVALYQQGIFG